MQNPNCYRAAKLIGGQVEKRGERLVYYTGGFSTVFEFRVNGGPKIAVRCWFADIDEPRKRTQTIAKFLKNLQSPYFVDFEYIEDALLVYDNNSPFSIPIVTMVWSDGMNLKDYLEKNIENRGQLLSTASKFLEMVRFFHRHQISHGDLQHGNIKVKSNGDLVVLDYDSMFVAGLEGMPDFIKGYPGYQHPTRGVNRTLNLKLDYFSELVIYLSLLVYADYGKEYWNYDTEWLVFSKEDYENPSESQTLNVLRKSSNVKIASLTNKLIASLRCSSISELKPLEELQKDHLDKIAYDISIKF